MNTRKSISIYAAGAIDLNTNTGLAFREWRRLLALELGAAHNIKAVVFDPSLAFKMDHGLLGKHDEVSLFVESVNTHALDDASMFVALVHSKTPSIGVPIELDRAYSSGKQLFVLTDIMEGTSLYLDRRVPSQSRVMHPIHTETDMEQAIKVLAATISKHLGNL